MTDEERADAITMLSLVAPTIRLSGEEMYRFDRAIRTAVMALQERKTGKWIVENDCEGKTRTLICPFCEWKSGKYAWEDYKYCPDCGAKMEVDE